METEELQIGNVHHGHNIRLTRIQKRIKQEALCELVHLPQPTISKYESMRMIDDEMLKRFAKALDVPFDYLKNLEENAPMMVFENNSTTNNENGGAYTNNSNTGSGFEANDNSTKNFNPIDKITELYERLLKEKDEKYAAIEKRIQSLEQNLQK